MSRYAARYQVSAKAANRQKAITKLDFLKTKLVMKILMLGGFVVGLSLFYIWSRIQIVQIGYEINEFKKEQRVLLEENKKLHLEMSLMKSPKRIMNYADQMLGMSFPDKEKIVQIP